MAEAMAACRRDLGPEALILSTRRVAGGVEVTAAAEDDATTPADAPGATRSSGAAHGSGGTGGAAWPGPGVPGEGPPGPDAPADRPALAAFAPAHPGDGSGPTLAPLPDAVSRPLALVGPPGAGKTLSLVKIATRFVMRGVTPLVLDGDAQRAGAHAQLAAFARVLGIAPRAVAAAEGARDAAAERARGQPVLLDTAGCDPFDPAQATDLLALLRATGAAPVLVLPAGLDAEEAAETARAFAALGARHLLPTRLDRPRRMGGVLAAAVAGGLSLTEAGTGPGAADGLTPITPAWLSARLGAARPHLIPAPDRPA